MAQTKSKRRTAPPKTQGKDPGRMLALSPRAMNAGKLVAGRPIGYNDGWARSRGRCSLGGGRGPFTTTSTRSTRPNPRNPCQSTEPRRASTPSSPR
jgi:hypothetical protein